MSEEWPNLNRNTRAAKRKRAKLIEQLGGGCALCPERDPQKLQFDHIHGRDWEITKYSYRHRINIYEREIAEGKIRLLCAACNLRERKRNDDGRCIPTIDAPNTPLTDRIPF